MVLIRPAVRSFSELEKNEQAELAELAELVSLYLGQTALCRLLIERRQVVTGLLHH